MANFRSFNVPKPHIPYQVFHGDILLRLSVDYQNKGRGWKRCSPETLSEHRLPVPWRVGPDRVSSEAGKIFPRFGDGIRRNDECREQLGELCQWRAGL